MIIDGRDLLARAARVRLVVSDVDGVLTDGGVYYSERGEELKRFSVKDGMGVERLRQDGIETAFCTREQSALVARRAEKLRIRFVHLGVRDKLAALPRIAAEARVTLAEMAYIGDDVNDAEVMRAVADEGLVGAPADARPEVRRLAHHIGPVAGGDGAFREFAEWLLNLRAAAQPAITAATSGIAVTAGTTTTTTTTNGGVVAKVAETEVSLVKGGNR